mmetsp:Transcript_12233/g.37495  ORF Transcript_12233/g.37495 Transcript_12233/m.37495 type:complete len:190 (-) Transcript_12233:322-891(-)
MSAPTLLSMPPSSFQPPPPLWSPPFIPPPPDLPPLPHQPPPSAPLPANFVCLDTCTSPNQNDASLKSLEHINNGVCEDGGPDVRANATQRNTSQTVCAFGTDCLDCGVRKLPDPYPWATTIVLVFIFVGLPLIFLWYVATTKPALAHERNLRRTHLLVGIGVSATGIEMCASFPHVFAAFLRSTYGGCN